jgi:hypothetical protein
MQFYERMLALLQLNAHAAWQRDAESYLAEATDHADLERRLKQLYNQD